MAEIGRGFAVIGYDDSEVREGMKRTGSALKGEMKSASSAASGELRRLQAAAAAAGTKATQTAARLSKATTAEANALGKLRVAQAQLNDVKDKGARGSAALVRAEEALAKAQRDAESATKEKSRALKADEIAQRRATDATEEVKKASTQAASAQDKLGKSGKDAGRKVASGMDTAEKKTSRFSRVLRSAGGALKGFGGVLAVGGIYGMARGMTSLLKEAEESATMASRTKNVIESTGGAAKVTAEQVDSLATALSNKSGADDEAIVNGANLMLTFTRVRNEVGKGNDVYTRATSLALDMSSAMGTDMKQSALQLGKALNDPTKGVTALTRSGVSFTQQQKEQIKQMQASGDLLGAQKLILSEVQKQFGGAAEAMADPSARISTMFGNLREQLGTALLPVAQRFADWMLNVGAPAISGFMDQFANSEGTAGQLRGVLTDIWDVLKQVGQAFMSVGGFILQHRTAFTALAVVVGGAVAVYKTVTMAMAAYSAVMTAYRAVAAAATAAQMALNLAFLSNPITWVIIGIVALVAALVVLYKKNEAFRNAVNAAWASIKAAIGAVVTWVTGTAVPWLVNAWNWIKNGAVALWARMVAIWNGIKSVIGAVAGWVTVTAVPWLANAWNWIRNGATSLWTAMRAIWNGIRAAISAVVTWIATGATAIWSRAASGFRSVGVTLQGAMRGIWNGIKSAISTVVTWHATVARAIWSRTSNGFRQVGMLLWSAMRAIWNGIRAVISIAVALMRGDIKGVISGFRDLWNSGAELRSRLVAAWTSLKNSIGRIAGQIRDGAIEGLKRAFTSLQNWVGKVRDGIVNVWNDMKGKVSEVTNWVKDKAIKPVLNAWNKVAGIVKLPQVDVSGWATGGYTGAGRKYEPAGIVHRDEYVIRKEATNRLRRTVGLSGLDYMNQTGRLPGHADGGLVGGVPGYARGGIAGKRAGLNPIFLQRLDAFVRGTGIQYSITSGYRSIAHQQAIWNRTAPSRRGKWVARPGRSKHQFGVAADIAPRPRSDAELAKYGLYRPMSYEPWHVQPIGIAGNPGGSGGGDDGGGGTSMPFWFAPFQAILDKVKGGIAAAVQGFGGHPFAQAMGGIPTALIDGLVKFVSEKFAVVDPGGSGDTGSNTPVANGPVRQMAQQLAAQRGWGSGAQWSALDWIVRHESGWNPNAQNPRSTAYGLFQFLNSTWRSVGIGKTSDPQQQIIAGLKYISQRYGSPVAAQSFWRRNNWYADGGLVKPTLYDTGGWLRTGTTVVQNNTGKPELVLTQEQLATIGRNGPSIVINGVKMDTVPDVMEAIRFAEARQRSGGRYSRMG